MALHTVCWPQGPLLRHPVNWCTGPLLWHPVRCSRPLGHIRVHCAFALRTDAFDDAGAPSLSQKSTPSFPGGVMEQLPGTVRLPINLDLDLFRARRLVVSGRREEAEALLRKAIAEFPEDGRAYVVLGRLLQKQRRTGAARAVYEQGCQALGGDNAYIWQAWAVLECSLGNAKRARKLFDAAIAADEQHAAAWHGWAMLELKEGQTSKARQLLERGIKSCGENSYIYHTLAVLEMQIGRLEQARALFLRSTQLNLRSAASWLAWALLEAQHGDPKSTRILFQKALEASPKGKYCWQAWGVFEASQGRYAHARKLLTRGIQLNPGDAVLLQALALLEYECGFTGTARELFKDAAVADPSHQPVWTAWAWMEWKEARLDVARRLYQKSVEVDASPQNTVRALHAWAILEERDSNPGLARALFKQALKTEPNNDVVWKSWASMEERLGNAVRADELRSLRQQQRVEVVEPVWDLSSVLSPALDTVMSLFFKAQQSSAVPPSRMLLEAAQGAGTAVSLVSFPAETPTPEAGEQQLHDSGVGPRAAHSLGLFEANSVCDDSAVEAPASAALIGAAIGPNGPSEAAALEDGLEIAVLENPSELELLEEIKEHRAAQAERRLREELESEGWSEPLTGTAVAVVASDRADSDELESGAVVSYGAGSGGAVPAVSDPESSPDPAMQGVGRMGGAEVVVASSRGHEVGVQVDEERSARRSVEARARTVEEKPEDEFDVDAFLAKRLPRAYERIMAEDEARRRAVWRRPASSKERVKQAATEDSLAVF